MRLVRLGRLGEERPAVLLDNETAVMVETEIPDYDSAFFASGGLNHLAKIVARPDLPRIGLTDVRVASPVAQPGKIVCAGHNYANHAEESASPLPEEPPIFFKAPDSLSGPFDDVLLPLGGMKTDWEVELAVVIAKPARYLANPDDAEGVIAGYAISNDVSERSFQLERGGQWVKGKSCETFNPFGPWLATPDEIGDPQDLELTCTVNGQTKQHSNTRDMLFGVYYLIWYISQFMVLRPGDIVNTGTPAGVGLGQDPPQYLEEGDVMELSIDGLGTQRTTCRRASAE